MASKKKILPNILDSAGGGLKSRIVSLSKWWNMNMKQQSTTTTTTNNDLLLPPSTSSSSSSSQLLLRLMDMRSSESYNNKERHHLLLCNNKNQEQQFELFVAATLPIDVIKERSFELPTRNVEFSIFVHPSHLDQAEEFLIGERDNRKGRKRPFKPWTIKHVLLDDDMFWKDAKDLGLVVVDTKDTSSKDRIYPYPRLWQPDPMVENILLPILKKDLLETTNNNDDDEEEEEEEGCTTGGGQIWDLGSGAGRDLVFLAEELLSSSSSQQQQQQTSSSSSSSLSSSSSSSSSLPYKLVGLDHRYNEKETRITMDFCSRRGVSQITSCKKLDCSKWDLIKDELLLQNNKYQQQQQHGTTNNNNSVKNNVKAMYAVRFWKPSLFNELAICDDSNIICSGMIVAMSNFCKPYEGSSWDYTNPNENIVLERNQLYNLFNDKDKWDIIHDEIVIEPDHGRPMIHFVAKRK